MRMGRQGFIALPAGTIPGVSLQVRAEDRRKCASCVCERDVMGTGAVAVLATVREGICKIPHRSISPLEKGCNNLLFIACGSSSLVNKRRVPVQRVEYETLRAEQPNLG